jgi:hypothetical protein
MFTFQIFIILTDNSQNHTNSQNFAFRHGNTDKARRRKPATRLILASIKYELDYAFLGILTAA